MITLVWARTWLRAAIVNSIVFASVCISKQIDDDLRLFNHYYNGHVTDPFFFFILPYLLWHRREVLNILLGVPTSKESLSRNFLKISKRISVLISTRANATQTLAMLLYTACSNELFRLTQTSENQFESRISWSESEHATTSIPLRTATLCSLLFCNPKQMK